MSYCNLCGAFLGRLSTDEMGFCGDCWVYAPVYVSAMARWIAGDPLPRRRRPPRILLEGRHDAYTKDREETARQRFVWIVGIPIASLAAGGFDTFSARGLAALATFLAVDLLVAATDRGIL